MLHLALGPRNSQTLQKVSGIRKPATVKYQILGPFMGNHVCQRWAGPGNIFHFFS